MCSGWLSWANGVDPSAGAYTRVEAWSSANGNVVYSCTTQSAVNQIANRLRFSRGQSSTANVINCDGRRWEIGGSCGPNCGSDLVLSIDSGGSCNCGGTLVIRPNIWNQNWGGVGSTCNGPTQSLNLRFVGGCNDNNNAPVLSCPSSQSVNTDNGVCCSRRTYSVSASDADSCSSLTGPTRTLGRASGSCFNHNERVSYSVSDSAGNSASCSWVYSVFDNQNPSISCSSNIVTGTENNRCDSLVNYSTPSVFDNCGISSLSRIGGLSSGARFPLGASGVTYRVVDTSGRSATCGFSVTVVDSQLPDVNCPPSISTGNSANACGANVNYAAPSVSDNCPGTSISRIAGGASGAFFPVGTTTQRYRGVDNSGNTRECSFFISVGDVQNPSINCPSSITIGASSGRCDAVVNYPSPTASDNCGIASIVRTNGRASGSVFPVSSSVITHRATDTAGRIRECSFTVTVVDNQNPTIGCPGTIFADADPGVCSVPVFYPIPGANDNCGIQSLVRTAGPASGSSMPVGVSIVSYLARDAVGRSASCSFQIRVADTEPPFVTCPSSVAINSLTTACGATYSFASASVSDNCAGASVTQIGGPSSGSFFSVGSTTQVFRGTDASGLTDTCSFSVTVVDNVNPSISCPASVTTNAANNQCQSAVTYGSASASDNCGISSVTRTAGGASGSNFQVGTTSVSFLAEDNNGRTSACSFSVTVIDNQNPTVTCPSSRTVSTTLGRCDSVVSFSNAVASDNCPGSTVSLTSGSASGSTFPIGSSSQTFTARDAAGRTTTCSFNILVEDNESPSANCPSDITVNSDLGNCGAIVSYAAPTASDNCGGASITLLSGEGSGGFFPVGTSTEVYRARDSAGNTRNCAFTVTVLDSQLPAITCPSNVVATSGPMQCGATVNFATPIATDNCAGVTVAQTVGIASGGFFPTGTTSQTFVATDAAGATRSCSFTVTVVDGEDPVATCPANIVEPNDINACGAVVTYASPTVADNCPGFTIARQSGLGSGAFFPVGTTTEVYLATDPEGNTHQCTFTVTVQDDQNPVASCPVPAVIGTDSNVCSAVYGYSSPTVADNCPGASIALISGFAIGGIFPEGVSTVIWRATDGAGNTNDCSFTVEVDDIELPVPTCPVTQTVTTQSGRCDAVVTYTAPTVSDNCPSAAVSLSFGLGSGSVFPQGTSLEVYQARDVTGNSQDCSFSVIVDDAENPTITCPSDIVTIADSGSCTARITYSDPTIGDNCPGTTFAQTSGMGSGALFPIGVTTEVYEAEDAAGNTATCQFTVTVSDAENPVASCPADLTVFNNLGDCSAVVSYTAPTVSDNCIGATIALSAGQGNGGTFPVGTSTEVYIATDAAGLTHTCSFTVTVVDNELPLPLCPAPFSVTSDFAQCGAIVDFIDPTATDNCPGVSIALSTGIVDGGFFPTGITTQVFEATDAAGNAATCSFTVTVNDGEDPVASCPSDMIVATDLSDCTAVVTYPTPTATDNCPGVGLLLFAGEGNGGTFNKGTNTEVYEATDAAGNTHRCSFTITVEDRESPVASCPADIGVSTDGGQCSAVVNYATPTTSDNCPNDVISIFNGFGSGAAFAEGNSVEVWEALDEESNADQCSFTITVSDNEAPVISCPASFFVNNDPGVCGATVLYTTPSATDNCAVASVVQTSGLSSGTVFPIGTTSQTWMATDTNGNTHSCSFDVTVNEVEDPVATCPSNMVVSSDVGFCSAVVTYSTPTFTDNCPGSSVALASGLGSGSTFPVGTTTEVYEVTDGALNTHQCSFTVTVVDNELPVATCPSAMTVGTDSGRCDAVVSYAAPTVTDNCPGSLISLSSGIGSGSTFALGSRVEEHTAVDLEGNEHTCFISVTVEDREAPVPSCTPDVNAINDVGECGARVSYALPTVTDNCPPASISLWSGKGDGFFFDVGTSVETYIGTDSAGNTAQCSFNVLVADNEVPDIICPGDIAAPTALDRCDSLVTYATPAATDNCAVSTVQRTAGLGSGSTFPLGISTESWQAVDIHGNSMPCSFNVEIQDFQLPTISCPPPQRVNNDAGQCGARVSYTAPSVADNCITTTVFQTNGLGSSSLFPIGETTEEFTVVDGSGNSALCSFTVTVLEAEDPVATCPGNISVNNDPGQCGASVSYSPPTVSDNCPGAIIAQTAGLGSGSNFPVGRTTEIYTATDNSGRTHSCQFIVEVLEAEDPVASCPSSISVPNSIGQCGAMVTYASPSATDNCPGVTIALTGGSGSGTFFNVGTVTETFLATDAAGNTDSCAFGVTVLDTESPMALCPSSVTQGTDSGVCDAVVNYSVTVADNCAGPSISRTLGLGSGATFPLGDTPESYLAIDTNGNNNACNFLVTIEDRESPVVTSPGDYSVFIDEPFNFSVSATDNCGAVTLTQDFGPLPTDSSPVVTTEDVQFTATDSAGNSQVVSFTIAIIPAAGGLGLNVYMYEDIELIVAPQAFNNDPWLQFEIRGVGNGPLQYRSEREPLDTLMRFDGPKDMLPGHAAFWVVSNSRSEWLADINICGSRYVNFPEGCAAAFP